MKRKSIYLSLASFKHTYVLMRNCGANSSLPVSSKSICVAAKISDAFIFLQHEDKTVPHILSSVSSLELYVSHFHEVSEIRA